MQKIFALAITPTILLTACGGGGSGTTQPGERPAPEPRSVTEVLEDGDPLTARHTAAVLFDLTTGTVTQGEWSEFAIALSENDNWIVTIDGLEHTFTDAEFQGDWAWQSEDNHGTHMWCWTCGNAENVAALFAGRNVATLADQGTSGHAVIGIPTTDFSGNAGRATYTNLSGTDGALLELRPSQGYGGIDDRIDLYADLALVADFSNQTLSGRLFNFTDDDDDSWRLEMAMPETPFTNEGFSGYFEVSGLLSGSSAVTYEGSFYGPNAQEVGGTIEGTIIGTGGIRYITTGGFAGSQ